MKKNTKKGFTLVELMVVLLILSGMISGVYVMLGVGRNTWANADAQIQVQNSLRQTVERVARELRETGSNSVGTMQVTINNGTGLNGSDVITFSIPVICQAGQSVINATGDVSYWGAPLRWGCTDSTCMDEDDNCLTVDYESVQYFLGADNQLLRRVLNGAGGVVDNSTTVFAQNIIDFQAALSGDENIITLTVTASRDTDLNRTITAVNSVHVYLRNKG